MGELRDGGSLADAAHELLAAGQKRVAVICNTVRSARNVLNRIEHPGKHLIIGRQRPLDRDLLLEQLLPRVRCGSAPTPPLVVVATQCIEASADFDFDGMVSEACPIDALRQRLGRLDRLGRAAASLSSPPSSWMCRPTEPHQKRRGGGSPNMPRRAQSER
jgi:CRISPR-associated endonuclease/helicase Cas3